MSDIGSKGSLTIKHNGLSSSYTPGDTSTFTLPHSALTLSYGNASNLTATTTYNTSATGSVTIPNTLKNISNGYVEDTAPTAATGTINIKKNVSVTGTITASGAIYSSDLNLKENISALDYTKASIANNVPIKEFNFKSDPSRKVYGVIAQEVESFGLNEMVVTGEDGYKGVDYTSLMLLKIGFLENEVKSLRAKLEALENKN